MINDRTVALFFDSFVMPVLSIFQDDHQIHTTLATLQYINPSLLSAYSVRSLDPDVCLPLKAEWSYKPADLIALTKCELGKSAG